MKFIKNIKYKFKYHLAHFLFDYQFYRRKEYSILNALKKAIIQFLEPLPF